MSNAGEEEQGSRSESRVENKQELELDEYAKENSDVKYCDEQEYKTKECDEHGSKCKEEKEEA